MARRHVKEATAYMNAWVSLSAPANGGRNVGSLTLIELTTRMPAVQRIAAASHGLEAALTNRERRLKSRDRNVLTSCLAGHRTASGCRADTWGREI